MFNKHDQWYLDDKYGRPRGDKRFSGGKKTTRN